MNARPYYEYVRGEPSRDSKRPREPRPGVTPEQAREAEQILACYETELEVLS